MTKHKVVSPDAWLEARKRLLPKGRDEADQQPYTMAWVRYRDAYGA